MKVLDTTAFSAAMREDAGILSLLGAHRPGEFAVVQPVLAEIEFGIRRLDEGSRKRLLLERQRDRYRTVFRTLPWTDAASGLFGSIKADLERRGVPVDDFDIAVAAIAMAHDAEVLTANLVHFQRITGLRCRHWEKT